jgi:5-methylcytosine-specific restriction endonuclease McrA
MRRAKNLCLNCGEQAKEVDHIIPRKGMPLHRHSCLHHQTNLRALCHDCHVRRKEWET